KRHFRPEFLNRIDDVVIFHKLVQSDIQKIVSLMIESLAKRLKENEIDLDYTQDIITHLAKVGYDKAYGARPLRRAITKIVEDKLSEEMLLGSLKKGDSIIMDYKDSKVIFIDKNNYIPTDKKDFISIKDDKSNKRPEDID
ncbi:MAG: hypothetical protein RR645_03015, partial [Clostridium sp.]